MPSAMIVVTRLLLRSDSSDPNLVDEIAGRVWYAIVTDPVRRLASFDPKRGCSLTTFLAGLAWNEIRDFFRSERRGKCARKRHRAERKPAQNSNRQMSLLIDEFLDLLTPRRESTTVSFADFTYRSIPRCSRRPTPGSCGTEFGES